MQLFWRLILKKTIHNLFRSKLMKSVKHIWMKSLTQSLSVIHKDFSIPLSCASGRSKFGVLIIITHWSIKIRLLRKLAQANRYVTFFLGDTLYVLWNDIDRNLNRCVILCFFTGRLSCTDLSEEKNIFSMLHHMISKYTEKKEQTCIVSPSYEVEIYR